MISISVEAFFFLSLISYRYKIPYLILCGCQSVNRHRHGGIGMDYGPKQNIRSLSGPQKLMLCSSRLPKMFSYILGYHIASFTSDELKRLMITGNLPVSLSAPWYIWYIKVQNTMRVSSSLTGYIKCYRLLCSHLRELYSGDILQ